MPTQALTLLNTLFAPGDIITFRPIESWIENGKSETQVDWDGIEHHVFGRNSSSGWSPAPLWTAQTIERVLLRSEKMRTNTYFGVCPREAPRLDQRWQIRKVRCLWADLDHIAEDAALAKCQEQGLPAPTAVVNSGNGVHLYWKLAELYLIDDAGEPPRILSEVVEATEHRPRHRRKYILGPNREKLYLPGNEPDMSPKALHIEGIMRGIANLIGGDSTGDLARILRLPGSMNRKNQRKGAATIPCELRKCEKGLVYPLDRFAQYLLVEQTFSKEQLDAVELPVCDHLTPKQQQRFAARILECEGAEPGKRSELDYRLCCTALEIGLGKETVWARVHGSGKFAERGRSYFDNTWDRAETKVRENLALASFVAIDADDGASEDQEQSEAPRRALPESAPLANARVEYDEDEDGKTKAKVDPLSMRQLYHEIIARTGGWPKRVGSQLFVHSKGEKIRWLDDTASLFAYLQITCGIVEWHRSRGCVTKEEAFAHLRAAVEEYDAIEDMPHEPMMADHYYTCDAVQPGDGRALDELIGFFCPESEVDAALLITAFVTPIWGGPPGTRPAFMFTAETGRGRGKSTLAKLISRFYGGPITVSTKEDIADIKTRMLTPSAATKRIALLDNVKTTRFSWADLEALITSDVISGRALYIGDAGRPNLFTWLITLNGASLSTDMAQRVVEVRLADPVYDGGWEAKVTAFMEDNREALVADMVAFLRRPTVELKRTTRWAMWENNVLARLDIANDCLDVVLHRRGEVDVEEEEAGDIEEYFRGKLEWLGYDVDRDDVFIPNAILTYWYNKATGSRERTRVVKTIIKQMRKEKKLTRLMDYKGEKGRGARWTGEHVRLEDRLQKDLPARLHAKLSEQEWSLLGIEFGPEDYVE